MSGKTLLVGTCLALILGGSLVVLCYFFVDPPVARFAHAHRFLELEALRWPVLISDWLKKFAPLVIVVALLWWAWKPGGRLQTTLLAISASLVVTTVLKQFLKWGCGRYWPETWSQNNPSLIGQGEYGFHPFQQGTAYQSFPSGHAAVICCILSVLWLSYPRWRWLYALVGACISAALVGMNYHFVGDVIAGVMLGSLVSVYAAHLFRLDAGVIPPRSPTSASRGRARQ